MVKELSVGDTVLQFGTTNDGAKITHILKCEFGNKQAELVTINAELSITPYHPIKLNIGDDWVFPRSVKTPTVRYCEAVYCIALEDGHVLDIGDIGCVGLGHDFEENDVIKHPYFGSRRIIDDLDVMPVNEDYIIVINSKNVKRNAKNNLICEISV